MKYLGWLGTALSILSYILTVNGMAKLGIPLATIGCVVYGYYAFKTKVWNLLALQAVFFAINVSGLVRL